MTRDSSKVPRVSSKIAPKKRKGAPHWAVAPFDNFICEVERQYHMVRLSSTGIRMIQAAPKAIKALMKVKQGQIDEEAQRLKSAQADADLARHEVKAGFPILYSWAVVGLWALLEATIRHFVSEWLRNKRTGWRAEPIRRLRIRIGDYESIPRNQRYSFIAEMLERETGVGLKDGVSRFEAMLDPFELSGDLPEKLRRNMYEFSQVRNLIAHKAGKVDRRFVDACPWLSAKVGDELFVSHDMFVKYHTASVVYATIIICRIGEHFGVDMSNNLTDVTASLTSSPS